MTNYTKATNFAAKDSLASGNAAKVVKGTEIDTEFTNIETAVNSKSDSANPVFTGVAEFADGSASAPSITNTADTNTGVFFPAADTIAFAEGGTESMRLDSSGNLGLGVTPSAWASVWRANQLGSTGFIAGRTNAERFYAGSNAYYNGTNWIYTTTGYATYYASNLGQHEWYNAASGTAGNAITFTQAMTLDASGNLGIGTTSPSARIHASTSGTTQILISGTAANLKLSGSSYGQVNADATLYIDSGTSSPIVLRTNGSTEAARIDSSGNLLVGTTSSAARFAAYSTAAEGSALASFTKTAVADSLYLETVSNNTYNTGKSSAYLGKNSSTSRSINAAGTINASGADYAEYMTKSGDFIIAKGDVCGIDVNGNLTNVFADAVSFAVKSTNPSYVGGDSWGTEESLGLTKPKQPAGDATDEEKAQYETYKIIFETALESERQKVDRIAFAGQVPVNVTGATAGQYIIPVNDNGAIKGQSVSNPTFEQYQIAVGKVIAIEQDGRAKIIVKVA